MQGGIYWVYLVDYYSATISSELKILLCWLQGGIYWFYLVDYYSATISLMYIALFETIGIVW